jgi:predicted NBD/HSP70 family sugar kinase
VVDEDGEMLDRSLLVEDIDRTDVAGVVDRVAAHVRKLLDRRPEPLDVIGLGVAIGGRVGVGGNVVYSPALGWRDVQLPALLGGATGIEKVLVQNDVDALALAELYFGAGLERPSFAVVTCRSGIGCSLIMHNRPVRGADGSSAELGHIVLEPDGLTCLCGNRGCLQTIARLPAVVDAVRSKDRGVETATDVLRLAQTGDDVAREALAHAGEALGRGLSMLVNIVSPGLIVLYGEDEVLGSEFYLEPAQRLLREYTFPTISCDILVKRNHYPTQARGVASEVLKFLPEHPRLEVQNHRAR